MGRLPIPKVLDAIPRLLDCYRSDHRFAVYDLEDGTRVVCIAGTDSLKDIINDLRARLVPATAIPGVKVHAGMLDAYLSCESAIRVACVPATKLLLVGHSMGSAIANLLAFSLVTNYGFDPLCIEVVTLGSPRTGNRRWSRAYDDAVPMTWRVATELDPVSRLPPPWGWRHVGQSLCLDEDGHEAAGGWALILHLLYLVRVAPVKVVGHSLFDYTRALRLHDEHRT